MQHRTALPICLIVLTFVFVSGGTLSAARFAPADPAVTVRITNDGLIPVLVSVKAGQPLTWINETGDAQHLSSGAPFRLYLPLLVATGGSQALADGARSEGVQRLGGRATPGWDVEIGPGESYAHTFQDPGSYDCYVRSHPTWVGRVTVLTPDAPTQAPTETTSPSPTTDAPAATATSTPTPASTATPTPMPTETSTVTPTDTATPSPTATSTVVLTDTVTPTPISTFRSTPGPSVQPLAVRCDQPSLAQCGFQYAVPYDIWAGSGSGNFGWLSWSGQSNIAYLAQELAPGNVIDYIDPHGQCSQLAAGCWVRGFAGVQNASDIRWALDWWIHTGTPMTIVVYDQTEGSGSSINYRVVGFVSFILERYDLGGGTLVGRFVP